MWRGTCGFKAPYGVVHGFLGATSYLKKKKTKNQKPKTKKKKRRAPQGPNHTKKKKN
jgi:hypothetical protein